jgi:drug/metabolite transporter (DMT)-like permease
MHKEHHGFLYGSLAALSSAVMAIFIKLSSDVPNEMLLFFRFLIGLPFMLWYGRGVSFTLTAVPKHLIRGIGGLLALYCYFYAVEKLPLVNAVTLSSAQPLFMPFIILIWFRLLVSPLRFWAIGIGFLGVLILMRPTGDLLEWGSLAGLGCSLFGAIALAGVRQLSKTESTESILLYYFIICTGLSFFPMIFTWKSISSWDWFYLVLIGLIATVYQYTLTKAYTHAPATKVSTLNYLSVVFGGISGWLVFGEVPDYWVLLGAVLIIISALMAIFDKTPARPL